MWCRAVELATQSTRAQLIAHSAERALR